MESVKDRVVKILDDFGMSGVKAAEIMGVTDGTFKNKKNDNSLGHSFNEKNLQDLINYIQTKAKEIKSA